MPGTGVTEQGTGSCVTLPLARASPHRTLLSRSTVTSGTCQLLASQTCDPHVQCGACDLTDPLGQQEPPRFSQRSCTVLLCWSEPHQGQVCEAPCEHDSCLKQVRIVCIFEFTPGTYQQEEIRASGTDIYIQVHIFTWN